ncbi:hypothetical protein [Bacillus cereus]|uniref:hypothetical protein n=1 Tax=Bacillus cereus TaxID=1396 RepID=UPI00124ED251|nr:hypothetical protein [Bacillus cereus]KAB2397329.1 hypothetical protein F8171_06595 [Bacillus cereus]
MKEKFNNRTLAAIAKTNIPVKLFVSELGYADLSALDFIGLQLYKDKTQNESAEIKVYRVLGKNSDSLKCNSTVLIATNVKTTPEPINCEGDKVESIFISKGEQIPYVTLKYGNSLFDNFSTLVKDPIIKNPNNLIIARDLAITSSKMSGLTYEYFRWDWDRSFQQLGGKFWSGCWLEARSNGEMVGHLAKIKNEGNPSPITFGFDYWFHDQYDEPYYPPTYPGDPVDPFYLPTRKSVDFGVSYNQSDKTKNDSVMASLWEKLETGYARRSVTLF